MPFELTKENVFSANVLGWLVIAIAVVICVWLITRQIKNAWLRNYVRAVALAVALTPTSVYGPGTLSPTWVIPAWYALWLGLSTPERIFFVFGAISISIWHFVLWLVGMQIYGLLHLLRRRRAA